MLLLLLLLMMMMMMVVVVVVVVVMMMMTTTMKMAIIMTTMMMLFFRDLKVVMMLFSRDLKVASRTSRTTLLALQVSAEQSVGWMTAMPSSTNPAYCIQIGPQKGGQNFDRRLLSTILDSGTRPYMPGKRATSRVERVIMLRTTLKPDELVY